MAGEEVSDFLVYSAPLLWYNNIRKEVSNMHTYDEIIRTRQTEIFNEVNEIEEKINQHLAAIEKLRSTKEQRIAEYNMLQHIDDRGLMDEGKKIARIDFETALKQIFEQSGKPMKVGDLIDRLEEFGYMWSNYQSAWYHIKNADLIQPTGARGYYNLIRGKF